MKNVFLQLIELSILMCSLCNEVRRKYIDFRCRQSMDKFIEIITSEDELLLRQFSVYIHKVFFN